MKSTTIKEKIEQMNKLYGYEVFALPGKGWPEKSILVLNQQGIVQSTITIAQFIAIR